jgi:hypothetical protein
MTAVRNRLAELERQLEVVDGEVAEHERELERLSVRNSISAEHAVRRAELAQRIRFNLDWLVRARTEMAAELAQELATW